MKKFLSVALVGTVALTLASCGSETDTNETTENTTTDTTEEGDVTTLTYLAWDTGLEGDDNSERAMIAMYEEANPNVDIEVLTIPEGGDYNSYIATLASSNQMPDVFMWGSVPDAVTRGWAGDMSEYANADEDYAAVLEASAEGGRVNEGVYGLPKALFYSGMWINTDIYAQNNVEPLQFGYTVDELMASIEANTTETTKGVENFDISYWYPMTQNSDYKFATFDGESYHFDSQEFADGVALQQEVTSNGWDLRNTTAVDFFGQEGSPWWDYSGIANQKEGTWYFDKQFSDEPVHGADYVGYPGGYSVAINDYIFVSDSTEHPQEAYEFAKWMSFGQEGILARMDLAETGAYGFKGIPLVAGNEEINTRFETEMADFPEFIKAYEAYQENPDLLVNEGFKEVPGFGMSVYEADTGVQGTDAEGNPVSLTMGALTNEIIAGNEKLADHAAKMTEIANNEYKLAVDALGAE